MIPTTEELKFELTPKKWYLSTTPYYFIYRLDKYNSESIRATLFNESTRVDDVGVLTDYEKRNHFDVINYFEAGISMGITKKEPKEEIFPAANSHDMKEEEDLDK